MEDTAVSREELSCILQSNGRFPDEKRSALWRYALQLPQNFNAYTKLSRKPLHHITQIIGRSYYFLPNSELSRLIRLSSNLANWFPFFVHIKYFPSVLIKFVDMYRYCPLSSFEVVATILENYCQYWFDDYPLSSEVLLGHLEAIIKVKEPKLAKHLSGIGYSASAVCWMLLSTLYTEVLDEYSWYTLWDHIILNSCKFFFMTSIAFIIIFRQTLLKFKSKGDLSRFHKPFKIDVQKLIATSKILEGSVTCDWELRDFAPLQISDNYELPRINHPQEFFVFEDLDRLGIYHSELKILSEELEDKNSKGLQKNNLDCKGDIEKRKRILRLMRNEI